jgi:hypothetical protein
LIDLSPAAERLDARRWLEVVGTAPPPNPSKEQDVNNKNLNQAKNVEPRQQHKVFPVEALSVSDAGAPSAGSVPIGAAESSRQGPPTPVTIDFAAPAAVEASMTPIELNHFLLGRAAWYEMRRGGLLSGWNLRGVMQAVWRLYEEIAPSNHPVVMALLDRTPIPDDLRKFNGYRRVVQGYIYQRALTSNASEA